jgi:hypothetical protein
MFQEGALKKKRGYKFTVEGVAGDKGIFDEPRAYGKLG